jgi:hypothetical protein
MFSSLPRFDSNSGGDARFTQLLILREVLMRNPHDAAAWFQLAALIGDPEREKFCLEQVLKIDPKHAAARARFEALQANQVDAPTTAESSSPAWKEARCPYVGLDGDPQSLAAYPSSKNYCHRLNEPKPVKLDYQQQYCLGTVHQRCLVYLRGEIPVAQSAKEKPVLPAAQNKPAINRSPS